MIWNETMECMDRETLRKIQSARLRKIVDYAYHNTPFYRRKMQQMGLTPDDIESIDALKERARKFLDYIKANFPSQAVFAVGHGIINKAIQSVYYNKEMKDIPPMQNAEVRKLEI